ncbi:gamma-aminobutyric acid receptor subunit pi-like [Tachypleus tridentatus]|uniref:gamma-aminobutyric acid receptor subunit pi-like n=1 Tax=Tachypleus tridentatus TaxID=6853 RepID=UPI003FD42A15
MGNSCQSVWWKETVCVTLLLGLKEVSGNSYGCNETMSYESILPKGYQKVEPPPNEKDTGPVSVFFSVQIYDIYGVNEESMDFYLHIYAIDIWEDSRLLVDCVTSEKSVKLPDNVANLIWMPDIYFENSKSGTLFSTTIPNKIVKILPDKSILRTARYLLQVSCEMNLKYYPMDRQICYLRTGLYSHPDNEVYLRWTKESKGRYDWIPSVKLIGGDELPEYKLVEVVPEKQVVTWILGNFSTLIVRFTFDRHLMAYLVNNYIPSSLVVVMSWLSFWLRLDAVPARVTLGVTSLLTLVTQVVQSRNAIPSVGYINALDIWLFICLNLVFATLVEYAIAYTIADNNTLGKNKICSLETRIVNDSKKKRLFEGNIKNANTCPVCNSHKTRSSDQAWMNCKKEHTEKMTEGILKNSISSVDKLSRVLFPMLFTSFVTIYWAYFTCNS